MKVKTRFKDFEDPNKVLIMGASVSVIFFYLIFMDNPLSWVKLGVMMAVFVVIAILNSTERYSAFLIGIVVGYLLVYPTTFIQYIIFTYII